MHRERAHLAAHGGPDQAPATGVNEQGKADDIRPQCKKRGRPKDNDPDTDRRIAEAWNTGRYPKYADLERELKLPRGEVRRAMDRHRKRERLANE